MDESTNNTLCTNCGNCHSGVMVKRPEKLTKNLVTRLKRIEGQVKGISNMVEKGVYCDDVLTQIAAVSSALSSVSRLLLESHMRTCIAERLIAEDAEVIDEFMTTIGKLIK